MTTPTTLPTGREFLVMWTKVAIGIFEDAEMDHFDCLTDLLEYAEGHNFPEQVIAGMREVEAAARVLVNSRALDAFIDAAGIRDEVQTQ
jgi:hypothetical protein